MSTTIRERIYFRSELKASNLTEKLISAIEDFDGKLLNKRNYYKTSYYPFETIRTPSVDTYLYIFGKDSKVGLLSYFENQEVRYKSASLSHCVEAVISSIVPGDAEQMAESLIAVGDIYGDAFPLHGIHENKVNTKDLSSQAISLYEQNLAELEKQGELKQLDNGLIHVPGGLFFQ